MSEALNNIDVWGWFFKEVTIDDKFNIVKDLYNFKRETIHGSAYRNELYLIDETRGIHTSWSGWRICDLEPVYKEVQRWNGSFYEFKEEFDGYKTTTNSSLKDYVESHKEECKKWLEEHIDLNEYNKRVENLENHRRAEQSHYYDLNSASKGEVLQCYIENRYSDERLYIESDTYGFNIEIDNILLGGKDETPLMSILKIMLNNRNMFKDFIELDKGYVFNNKYYETIEDIAEHIECCIKNKRLHNKFVNNGLNAEDIKTKE